MSDAERWAARRSLLKLRAQRAIVILLNATQATTHQAMEAEHAKAREVLEGRCDGMPYSSL